MLSRGVYTSLAMMNRCFRVLFLLLGVCLVPAAIAQAGFVHTSGPDLVDGQGKPLILRGTNLGNWFEPEGYMFHLGDTAQSPREIEELSYELIGPEKADAFWKQWRETYITAADIDRIKAMGFNSVRVPIHWKFFDSENADGFRLLDQLVEWARKDHIYVIIDLHCAPGGQTGTNIDDSYGYPWLYLSPDAQKQTIALWRGIAAHYAKEPVVLGYDLLNEPIPHFPQLQRFNPDLEPLYRRMVAAVRELDPNHVVILGGAQWDGNFSVFGPPFDSNTAYTFHQYWMTPDQKAVQKYVDFRDKYDVPVWLGESGENTDAWIATYRAVLEKNDIGWAFWPYKKMAKTSAVVAITPPEGWDQLVAFAKLPRDMGHVKERVTARPSQEVIDRAFAGLLENIQLRNCHVNAGYLSALGMKPVSAQ